MRYRIFHNVDSLWMRPHRPTDRVVAGYHGDIDGVDDVESACRAIMARHNRDDRPDGCDAPSLSVGDVIVVGETTWTVAALGFEATTLHPSAVVNGPYLQVVHDLWR
jgi:hypothetical protein